jgi:hypothetical protein
MVEFTANKGSRVNAKSLFRRAAITAPEKPIHNVKCWTRTGDATTPVVPNSRVITSKAGSKTSAINTNKVKYFSIDFILKYDKRMTFNWKENPFLF